MRLPAFAATATGWSGSPVRGSRSACARARAPSQRFRAQRTPRASLGHELATASVLLAEIGVSGGGANDLYRTIFLGGLGIIGSGIVGAFVVSFIVRANFEEVCWRVDSSCLVSTNLGHTLVLILSWGLFCYSFLTIHSAGRERFPVPRHDA